MANLMSKPSQQLNYLTQLENKVRCFNQNIIKIKLLNDRIYNQRKKEDTENMKVFIINVGDVVLVLNTFYI